MFTRTTVIAALAASAVSLAAMSASASSQATAFPELMACTSAKGTWYKDDPGKKYKLGHNIRFVVQEGNLLVQDDSPRVSHDGKMGPLVAVSSITRTEDGAIHVKLAHGTTWELRRNGNGFTGLSRPQNYTPSNLEFSCGA